ncbi:MAG: HXXEE domain-containing protein [Candidatus Promineifilaceae bacterium]
MNDIVGQLQTLDFSTLIWLFPAAITLHMIEEMIWLPAWSQTAGSWHIPVSSRQFNFASIALLVVIYGLTAVAAHAGRGNVAVYLVLGLALTMWLNIYYPHVGSTIDLGRYGPGLVTAILINLPLMPFLIWRAIHDGYVDGGRFLLFAVPMVIVAALGWSALLYAGSILLE